MLFQSTDRIYRANNPPRSLEKLFEKSQRRELLFPADLVIPSPSGMVVLSQQIDEDGLCELTKGRVERGVQAMGKETIADYLVMAERDMHTGKDLPLAREMWEYAFELGYPKKDRDGEPNIRFNTEDRATETFLQLLRFVRDLALPRGWKSVGVCTDDYQLAKVAPFAELIVGNDLDLWYLMKDTSDIFTEQSAHEGVFTKQFDYANLAIKMHRGVRPGVGSHKEILRRLFSEHSRYKGKDPGKFITNLP